MCKNRLFRVHGRFRGHIQICIASNLTMLKEQNFQHNADYVSTFNIINYQIKSSLIILFEIWIHYHYFFLNDPRTILTAPFNRTVSCLICHTVSHCTLLSYRTTQSRTVLIVPYEPHQFYSAVLHRIHC